MSNRVTNSEVKTIIDTDVDVTAFITVANLIVTNMLSGGSLSDAMLKEIERWLSAHFVAIRDPRIGQEKIGDASVTYLLTTGKGLDATPFGQQVKVLDTTGKLAQLGKSTAKLETII